MGSSGRVLLLHESGELEDVATLLRSLGFAVDDQQGPAPVVLPTDLLIATARCALALPPPPSERAGGPRPSRLAVVSSESPGLRAGLRGSGFELLVRRPVHPTALRLLLLRVLYRGPERRRQTRVAVGAASRHRAGLWWRQSVLTELSAGGCRLLAPRAVKAGQKVRVEIPDPGAAGSPLRMAGHVVRANAVSPTDPTFTLAIEFSNLSPAMEEQLAAIMRAYAAGPASMARGWDLEEGALPPTEASGLESGTDANEPDAGAATGVSPDRRRATRASYAARVVTLGEEAARVVLGRDLSVGGLRIEPHGGLERGQRLSVALHGAGLAVPLVVSGSILRDDGNDGLVMRFDPLSAKQRDALEKLMAGLGGIERLDPDVEDGGRVMTQILPPPGS